MRLYFVLFVVLVLLYYNTARSYSKGGWMFSAKHLVKIGHLTLILQRLRKDSTHYRHISTCTIAQ